MYQVNCTFYDALGRDDTAYWIDRALQFFAPGIPQVYYVGLLAGTNDLQLLSRSRVGRDINRHYYSPEEVQEALARPLVQRLLDLIRFRNTHPAFQGDFHLESTPPEVVSIVWRAGSDWARLEVNLAASSAMITYSSGEGTSAMQAGSPDRTGDRR
jgi:sucrose phosphorylase